MLELGRELKALRQSKGWTLREVERLSGVSCGYLSQLENGKVKHPSPVILVKLGETLGVPAESLLAKARYLPSLRASPSLPPFIYGAVQDLDPVDLGELEEFVRYLRFRKKGRRPGR